MRKYNTYPELRRIVIHFLRDLSRKARYDTYTVIKSINKDSNNDKQRRFILHTYIQKHLWEVNEAVLTGFYKYMETEFNSLLETLEYHDSNCKFKTLRQEKPCAICKLENSMKYLEA